MKPADLSRMSVEELLSVRETLNEILSSKIGEERRNLELRIEALNRVAQLEQPFEAGSRRFGKIPPKYQNPERPSETWAGRGKTPVWLAAALKRGRAKEDFLIDNAAPAKVAKARRR